jgi:hypothetical protein
LAPKPIEKGRLGRKMKDSEKSALGDGPATNHAVSKRVTKGFITLLDFEHKVTLFCVFPKPLAARVEVVFTYRTPRLLGATVRISELDTRRLYWEDASVFGFCLAALIC